MNEAIEAFKQYLSHRYPGRSTTKHYMSDLAIFCEFVGDAAPQAITVKMIDQFVKMQVEQSLKPATINRRLSTLSSFFEYLIGEKEDHQWQNPVHWRRHSIRPGRHLPRDVSDPTVEALLGVIEDQRDRAMVMFMLGAGLRIGEVVRLELTDFSEADATGLNRLRVHGKGDKERIVWLTPEVFQPIHRWLAERPPSKSACVFLNQHGRPMSVSGVQFRLNQYCQIAGIRLTAHQLRHTYARRLVERNLPVESLAKLLGHNQLTTTQRYIDGADPTLRADFFQAMAQIQADHPLESMNPLPVTTLHPIGAQKTTGDCQDAGKCIDELLHLAAGLPDWLRERLVEHTLRRAARWPAHRLKAQIQMHFGSLCRIGHWLIRNRNWQQLNQLQRTDLVAYLHDRQESGLKPRSIASQLTIFRIF